jgi:hypothetical protein
VPDVQLLLDAGLLQLAEPEPGPVLPTSAELHRARVRRYRQRQRAKRRSLGGSERTMAVIMAAEEGGAKVGIV